jgi:hypothetical protein
MKFTVCLHMTMSSAENYNDDRRDPQLDYFATPNVEDMYKELKGTKRKLQTY